jgi:hypothetical protein
MFDYKSEKQTLHKLKKFAKNVDKQYKKSHINVYNELFTNALKLIKKTENNEERDEVIEVPVPINNMNNMQSQLYSEVMLKNSVMSPLSPVSDVLQLPNLPIYPAEILMKQKQAQQPQPQQIQQVQQYVTPQVFSQKQDHDSADLSDLNNIADRLTRQVKDLKNQYQETQRMF